MSSPSPVIGTICIMFVFFFFVHVRMYDDAEANTKKGST